VGASGAEHAPYLSGNELNNTKGDSDLNTSLIADNSPWLPWILPPLPAGRSLNLFQSSNRQLNTFLSTCSKCKPVQPKERLMAPFEIMPLTAQYPKLYENKLGNISNFLYGSLCYYGTYYNYCR